MRVGEEIHRLADRRPRNVGALAALPDLGLRQLRDHLLERRDQPRAFLAAHQVGGEARIGGELLQAELLDEAAPLLVARYADEEFAVRGGEDLVDRPGAAAGGHGLGFYAGDRDAGHMGCHQKRGALEQRAAHALALAGRLALAQRRLYRHHAEHRTEDVDDRRAGAQWPAGRPGHIGKAHLELHHLVERRAVLVGAGEIAFEREVDEARVDLRQRLVTAAEPLHGAGPVVLEHHVGVDGEAVQGRLALGALKVEGEAALVAIEGGEEAGGEAAEAAGVVAARRRLDLDDVGAKVGEHEAAGRPHHRVAELQDLQPGQGPCGHQRMIPKSGYRFSEKIMRQ